MKKSLLSILILTVSLSGMLTNCAAEQTVTITRTVTLPAADCSGVPLIYVQALEILLLIVLATAAVIAVFLIRLYRKTRF